MPNPGLKRTQSTYGILAMLSDGPKSGYEIKKLLSEGEMFYWKESYGNIYPILRKLTEDQLVCQIDADIKKKRRIYYELTDSGYGELQEWLRSDVTLSRFRVDLLMKLRYGASTGIGTMISHIERYREIGQKEIEECDRLFQSMTGPKENLEDEVRYLIVRYFIQFKRALVEWCNESIEILREREKKDASRQ